jgi:tRNA dimethylallyltransferase
MSSLGYKHIVRHLQGSCTLAEAVQMTKRDTRRYAKRQMTWFGADSEIRWRSGADVERLSGEIGGFLSE